MNTRPSFARTSTFSIRQTTRPLGTVQHPLKVFCHGWILSKGMMAIGSLPKRRFGIFTLIFEMEKDECNLIAAKAFKARMNGDKKRAAEFEQELEDVRHGKKRHTEERQAKSPIAEESGDVEIVAPLDEQGRILPALLKKVRRVILSLLYRM